MEFVSYFEHLVVFLLFILSVRYLVSIFMPTKESACSKGCGKKCAVANLEAAMEQALKDAK